MTPDLEASLLVALAAVLGGVTAVFLFLFLRGRERRRAFIVVWCEFCAWRDRQAGTKLHDDLRFRLWSEEQRQHAVALARAIAWARTRGTGVVRVEIPRRLQFPSRDWPPVREAFAACGWDLRETLSPGHSMGGWSVYLAAPQVYVVRAKDSARDEWTLARDPNAN